MVLKLQRADGVRDVLDRIRLAVREVVHRIDAPLVAGAMMLGVQNAVHHRVAQVEVGRGHVDFRPQGARAVGKLAGPHALEQIEILFHRAVAIRAFFAGLGQRAAIFAHLLGGEVADVRLAVLDQLDGPFIQLPEIVGGIKQALPNRSPASARPS